MSQEDLISSRNQISSHNQLIQELKKMQSNLEQDVSKKEQHLEEQKKMLQEIQKDKVSCLSTSFFFSFSNLNLFKDTLTFLSVCYGSLYLCLKLFIGPLILKDFKYLK